MPLGPLWDGHNQVPGPRLLIAGYQPLPADTTPAQPPQVHLVRFPLQFRRTQYEVRPPTVLIPGPYETGISVQLSRLPARARFARHFTTSPATLQQPAAFIANPVEVTLARLPARARHTVSTIGPPRVVAPAITFPPARVKLVRLPTGTRQARSRLSPPAVVAPAVVQPKPKVTLVQRPVRARRTSSTVKPPAVVNPAVVFAALRTWLTRFPLQFRRTRSTVNPPATLVSLTPAAPFAPVRVHLAAKPPQRHTISRVNPPTVVAAPAAPFLAARPTTSLAKRPAPQGRTVQHWVRPPAVTVPAVTFRPAQTHFAQPVPRNARKTTIRLTPRDWATTLTQPVITLDGIHLVTRPVWQLIPTHYKIRPPAVTGPAVVFARPRVLLTRQQPPTQIDGRRRTHSRIGLSPVFAAPIVTTFFGPPNPGEAGLVGQPDRGAFQGSPDNSGLRGQPDNDAFAPPHPGRS